MPDDIIPPTPPVVIEPQPPVQTQVVPSTDSDLETHLKGVIKSIGDMDSLVPTESMKSLQSFADPKLRLDILSQIFYIKKISESQDYGSALNSAVKELHKMIPELPYEKLLLAIDSIQKVKASTDLEIGTFLTKGRESDAKYLDAQAKMLESQTGGSGEKVQVNIDNRTAVSITNPVTEKARDIPPEILDKILRLSETIIDKVKEQDQK